MRRFFADNGSIGSVVRLTGENAEHIARVLRLRAGDEIVVCDGGRTDYCCKIVDVAAVKSKYQIIAEPYEKRENTAEPRVRITLFQGLPKADKMELIIQKAVELGVYEIVPFIAERTVARNIKEDAKTERFQKISEAAAKQSGRGIIPKITGVSSLGGCLERALALRNNIVAYESERKCHIKRFLKDFKGDSLGIFIGPEGGFSDNEIKKLGAAGAVSVSLGKRILRAETAGFAAIACVIYETEEW